ncbi:MAG: hypothetical protein ACON5A_05145 [Candidatus Comchoanobacterales bacterium]
MPKLFDRVQAIITTLESGKLTHNEVEQLKGMCLSARTLLSNAINDRARIAIKKIQMCGINFTNPLYVLMVIKNKLNESLEKQFLNNALSLPVELFDTEQPALDDAILNKDVYSVYDLIFTPQFNYIYKIKARDLSLQHAEAELNWDLMNIYLSHPHRALKSDTNLNMLLSEALEKLSPSDIKTNGYFKKDAYLQFLSAHKWSLSVLSTMIHKGHWESMAHCLREMSIDLTSNDVMTLKQQMKSYGGSGCATFFGACMTRFQSREHIYNNGFFDYAPEINHLILSLNEQKDGLVNASVNQVSQ